MIKKANAANIRQLIWQWKLPWLWGVNRTFFFFSQTYNGFESDLPCFDSVFLVFFESNLPCFDPAFLDFFFSLAYRVLTQNFSFYWVELSLFWLTPSHLFSQSSSFFESVLTGFPSVLLIFWVSFSQFLKSNFSSECFLLFHSDLRCFDGASPSDFFGSVLPIF